MSQITQRIDQIAQPLLEHLGLGKAAIRLALPKLHTVAANPEYTATGRFQTDLAQIRGKAAEQLLSQPGRAQQPLALSTISDDDFRLMR